MKRMLSALLALVLLAAPALAQGYKLDFIDEQGVYLEVLTTEWKEDKLRFDVVVENNTGREIDLRIEDAYAGSAEIDGVGIYGVEDGARDDDEFFFLQPLDGDSMAVLENADVLSFTIEVQDEESHDTLFAVPVTLNVVNFPAATPGFPTDAEPTYAPEVLLILPEGGYGEWQFVDGDMLRMRVTVENTSPARAVEAFEIYMYATDAWGDPIYGEDYVYYETTEKLVEPFETAMSAYVTMPRASDISRVYAGIHRVKYDNGEVVEADPVHYAWWDIE